MKTYQVQRMRSNIAAIHQSVVRSVRAATVVYTQVLSNGTSLNRGAVACDSLGLLVRSVRAAIAKRTICVMVGFASLHPLHRL